MTARELEALFKQLKQTHPGWTDRFTSGYIAGVVAEGLREKPDRIQVDKAREIDHYALGYLTGFAVHRGSDVEQESWFSYCGLLVEMAREET